MTDSWCVRAVYGTYTQKFLDGGYVAIGGSGAPTSRRWLFGTTCIRCSRPLIREVASPLVVGQQVGQIARFVLEIQPGDFVITPARQLVDLLVEHWIGIPEDFQKRLGLKPGLVLG